MSGRRSLLVLSLSGLLAAQEPGNIYIPGAEDLDAQGQALLAQGNADLKASYHMLEDQHDPAEAERLLSKVISIQAQVMAALGTAAPGKMKVGVYGKARKNRDIIETSGGLDAFSEMDNRSLTTILEYDFKVHKRQVLASLTSKAKDIQTLQKYIVDELYDRGNVKSRTGGPTGPQKPEASRPGAQKPQQPDDQRQPDGPRRMNIDGQSPSAPASPGTGGQVESALLNPSKNTTDPQQQPTADRPATPPGAQPPASGPTTTLPPTGLPSASGNPGAGAAAAAPAAKTPEELAQQQDQVAKSLEDIAAKSLASGTGQDTKAIAAAFRHAASAARAAAAAIRSGDALAARSAATSAQRATEEAFAAAQGTGEAERSAQASALEQAVGAIQTRQAAVVGDAKRLADAVHAGTMGAEEAKQAGTALAQRQASIKDDLELLKQGIDDLAGTPSGSDDASAAVQEGLHAASSALQTGRAAQEAVNATIEFQQGHHAGALTAIAKESVALEQAHARLADAADAAAGGHGSDRQALNKLQQLSTGLRRLSQTAQAAVAGSQAGPAAGAVPGTPADPLPPATASTPARNDGTASAERPASGAQADIHPLPGDLGAVLDATALSLTHQLESTLASLPHLPAAAAARIAAQSRAKVEMGKDPSAGIAQLAALIDSVEGLEADLSTRISQDQQHAALETFLQDPVPAGYRSSVAAYYQLLADDGSAPALGVAPAAAPAAPAPVPAEASPPAQPVAPVTTPAPHQVTP